jgi:hypothetical protein
MLPTNRGIEALLNNKYKYLIQTGDPGFKLK